MKRTPKSSGKSYTTTTTTMDDICYFPGCRKDANCNCEICLASINATRDLLPTKSTLTKLSASKPTFPQTPISFNPTTTNSTTPRSHTSRIILSPPVVPPPDLTALTAGSDHDPHNLKTIKKEKKDSGFGFFKLRLIMGLCLIFMVEIVVSWGVSTILQPKLSPEMVRNVGEKSCVLQSLNDRLFYLKKELEIVSGKNLSGCHSVDSKWEIVQDELILNSRCVLYKSGVEKVSIWGWPLQTSGLLTTALTSASFTILSGSVTEWSNGEMRHLIRRANSSWEQGKWGASVLYLDQNTWIIEYKRSFLVENPRVLTAAAEFLKIRILRKVRKMKQEVFCLLSSAEKQYSDIMDENHITPT